MKNIAKLSLVLVVIGFQFVINQAYAQHHPGPQSDGHHADGHSSAHTGGPDPAAAVPSPGGGAAVRPRWTVGEYAVDFSMPSHLQAGTEGRLAVRVIDRQSGAPARGLPVELVLIPLGTPKAHGGHGVAEAAGHPADKDQVASTYRTVTPLPLIEEEHTPGSYEAKHVFQEAGPHLVLLRVRPNLREYGSLPLLVEDAGGHPAGGTGPNYMFLGFLLSTMAVTVLMVAFLRHREQPDRVREVR